MKKKKYYFLIFIIFLIDQITKIIVSNNINLNGSTIVIKNFFNLTYVKNTGAAFGFFSGKTLLITIISIFIFIYLLIELIKNKSNIKIIDLSFSFILGGLIGNLYDRVVLGYVRDFMDFTIFNKGFAIFNIGDVFIVLGCFLFLIGALMEVRNDYRNRK